jgi:hypothetical protein
MRANDTILKRNVPMSRDNSCPLSEPFRMTDRATAVGFLAKCLLLIAFTGSGDASKVGRHSGRGQDG